VTSGRLRESQLPGRAAGHAHCRETPPVQRLVPGACGSTGPSKGRRSVMNPINVWPLLGDHPSWCSGWLCTRTTLGHEHRSAPTYLTLGDDRWELSLQRADEPGAGEVQISAVVTSGTFCHAPVEHVFALADADELIEHLTEITEQARAESPAPVLEVVR
jgi:hypothetical protein